jgi:hypothetical protein
MCGRANSSLLAFLQHFAGLVVFLVWSDLIVFLWININKTSTCCFLLIDGVWLVAGLLRCFVFLQRAFYISTSNQPINRR